MSETQAVFEIEREDETLIVVPHADLRELDFDRIEEGAETVLQLLDQREIRNLVMDFRNTDYYGSTALSFFVKLWKRVKSIGGKMAFCNVSEHEREILKITNLDSLWSVCTTRDDALTTVRR